MSTQAQHMGSQSIWDQSHYASLKQPLQLEDHSYPIEAPSSGTHYPQRPAPGRYTSHPSSSTPFVTPSNFAGQTRMHVPSFNSLNPGANLALGTSSVSQPVRLSAVYSQQSLDPSSSGSYQASQFGTSLEPSHTPDSPTPNVGFAATNPSTSHSFLPAGPMQFSPPLALPLRQSEIQARYFNAQYEPYPNPSQNLKRSKPSDDHDDSQGEQPDAQEQEATKPRHAGACARCKSLKVRCEFKNDNDTCRRCTGAGQECVIPGRKPRRVPPKREHLLNQIREQAKQIQELMAKVETLSHPTAQSPGPQSPTSMHSPLDSNSESVVPNAEMQDWISRARVSIREFGGLIPAGDFVDVDDSYPSDEDVAAEEYSDDESGYATAEDDTIREIGSPASSTARKQAAHNTSLKLLPGDDAPYGLMAALAIRKSAREKSVEPESSEAVGVANTDFFRPSPGPDTRRFGPSTTGVQLPHILTRQIVTIKEVDSLFAIFFEKMNPSASLLDQVLHTPQYVAMRSPFLFTTICAIVSRFYEPRPTLYQQLIQYAQLAAGTALISGPKNEEMSAAYLLMQLYPVPKKRWDEERSWIYLGVAIRVAQDINLNRPVSPKPLNEQNARILLSRQRIWMSCFNLDRSTGSQYGKRPIIPNTDYFASHSENWWRSSPYNIKGFDIHLCGYNAELKLMCDFTAKIYGDPNHPTGLDKTLNIAQLASNTDDELRQLGERWFKLVDEFDDEKTETWEFRSELLKMAYAYSRLVALSTGLKHAKGGQLDEGTFIKRCLDAAIDIVNAFVRRLFPTPERKILFRHAPDGQFVFVTFAGAFLVKLLQPKYAQYFTYERRQEIRTLVQEAVDLLGAPEVVVDDKHGPALFSRFLAGLLATQSVDPHMLSPLSPKSVRLRRFNSRSKGKESSGSTSTSTNSSPMPPYASGSELSPLSGLSGSSSPVHHFAPLEANSRGQSPLTADFGLLGTPDIYQGTPMPVDPELLDSIQFLSDPMWQETSVPGFNWVNQLNTVSGSALHANDYALYEQQYATLL